MTCKASRSEWAKPGTPADTTDLKKSSIAVRAAPCNRGLIQLQHFGENRLLDGGDGLTVADEDAGDEVEGELGNVEICFGYKRGQLCQYRGQSV